MSTTCDVPTETVRRVRVRRPRAVAEYLRALPMDERADASNRLMVLGLLDDSRGGEFTAPFAAEDSTNTSSGTLLLQEDEVAEHAEEPAARCQTIPLGTPSPPSSTQGALAAAKTQRVRRPRVVANYLRRFPIDERHEVTNQLMVLGLLYAQRAMWKATGCTSLLQQPSARVPTVGAAGFSSQVASAAEAGATSRRVWRRAPSSFTHSGNGLSPAELQGRRSASFSGQPAVPPLATEHPKAVSWFCAVHEQQPRRSAPTLGSNPSALRSASASARIDPAPRPQETPRCASCEKMTDRCTRSPGLRRRTFSEGNPTLSPNATHSVGHSQTCMVESQRWPPTKAFAAYLNARAKTLLRDANPRSEGHARTVLVGTSPIASDHRCHRSMPPVVVRRTVATALLHNDSPRDNTPKETSLTEQVQEPLNHTVSSQPAAAPSTVDGPLESDEDGARRIHPRSCTTTSTATEDEPVGFPRNGETARAPDEPSVCADAVLTHDEVGSEPGHRSSESSSEAQNATARIATVVHVSPTQPPSSQPGVASKASTPPTPTSSSPQPLRSTTAPRTRVSAPSTPSLPTDARNMTDYLHATPPHSDLASSDASPQRHSEAESLQTSTCAGGGTPWRMGSCDSPVGPPNPHTSPAEGGTQEKWFGSIGADQVRPPVAAMVAVPEMQQLDGGDCIIIGSPSTDDNNSSPRGTVLFPALSFVFEHSGLPPLRPVVTNESLSSCGPFAAVWTVASSPAERHPQIESPLFGLASESPRHDNTFHGDLTARVRQVVEQSRGAKMQSVDLAEALEVPQHVVVNSPRILAAYRKALFEFHATGAL